MFFKIGVIRIFATFTGNIFGVKTPGLGPATLFKRDFNAGVFLCILRNFYEKYFFYRTSLMAVFAGLINYLFGKT